MPAASRCRRSTATANLADPRHHADQPARRARPDPSAPPVELVHDQHLDDVNLADVIFTLRRHVPRCRPGASGRGDIRTLTRDSEQMEKRTVRVAAAFRSLTGPRLAGRNAREGRAGDRRGGRARAWFDGLSRDVPALLPVFLVRRAAGRCKGRRISSSMTNAVVVPGPVTLSAQRGRAASMRWCWSLGVNERDGGTLYNAQLVFDADGSDRC